MVTSTPICIFKLTSNQSVASRIKPHVIQRNIMILITSNYFQQYITRFTVAKIVSEYDQEIPQSQTADNLDIIKSDVALQR